MNVRCTVLAVVTILTAGAARAQPATTESSPRFWLQVAVFQPTMATTLRIDDRATGMVGTELDLERHLGLAQRKTTAAALLGARLGERWRIELERFELKRSAKGRRLEGSITVENTTFETTAVIDTRFATEVTRASLGYSLFKSPSVEVGAVLGLYVSRFDFGLTGQATVGGLPTDAASEAAEGTAPLPTLGAYGSFMLSPAWSLEARADVFKLRHDGYDGRLLNVQAEAAYRLNEHASLGFGYRYVDYRLDVARTDLNGRVDVKFRGPQLILRTSF